MEPAPQKKVIMALAAIVFLLIAVIIGGAILISQNKGVLKVTTSPVATLSDNQNQLDQKISASPLTQEASPSPTIKNVTTPSPTPSPTSKLLNPGIQKINHNVFQLIATPAPTPKPTIKVIINPNLTPHF